MQYRPKCVITFGMASSGKLIELVSGMFGLPKDRVAYAWRRLREEGVIITAGRGRSAPSVSALDAAHLVIAVVADFPHKDTIEAWQECSQAQSKVSNISGGTPFFRPWSFEHCGVEGLDLPALTELTVDHTFAEALAALITAAGDGSLNAFEQRAGGAQVTVKLTNAGLPGIIYAGPSACRVVRHYVNEPREDPTWGPHGDPYLQCLRIFESPALIKIGELIACDERGKQ